MDRAAVEKPAKRHTTFQEGIVFCPLFLCCFPKVQSCLGQRWGRMRVFVDDFFLWGCKQVKGAHVGV